LVLLPEEEVVNQLGALYLTNRRVILYAPSILRAAFLRDIDAIGTLTERASGWSLILAVLFLAAAGVTGYLASGRTVPWSDWPLLSQVPTWALPAVLAALGLLLLAAYFLWVKKSLFLSVGGRPLIVVSLSGWSAKKLEGVDTFVNAFSQARDALDRRH
jgi:hypothetical protein